jgi:hypothetical protein
MALVVRPWKDEESAWTKVSNLMVAVGLSLLGGSLVHSDVAVWTLPVLAATTGVAMVLAGRWLKSWGLTGTGLLMQMFAAVLLLPIQWWEKSTAVSFLGLYFVPAALAAPYVGLTWLLTPRLALSKFDWVKRINDLGIAVFVTLCFAALLHTQMLTTSLAALIITCALVLMLVGGLRRSVGLSVYGIGVLVSGTIATIATQWWSDTSWGRVMGQEFGAATLVVLYAAAAWLVTGIAALRLEFAEREHLGRLCMAAAMALVMAAAWHVNANLGSVCLAWLGISATVGVLRKLRPQLGLDLYMLAGLVPASIAWIAKYAVDWQSPHVPLLLHPGLAIAGLLAGAWVLGSIWSARTPGRAEDTGHAMTILGSLAALAIVFASTSLEVARIAMNLANEPQVRSAAVSIWWGIFGVMLIAAGFWRRVTPARHTGLGLMAVAMAKAVIVDLAGVPQLWRIASFIGLGLLMLGVAVVYSRVSVIWNERLEASEREEHALPT